MWCAAWNYFKCLVSGVMLRLNIFLHERRWESECENFQSLGRKHNYQGLDSWHEECIVFVNPTRRKTKAGKLFTNFRVYQFHYCERESMRHWECS